MAADTKCDKAIASLIACTKRRSRPKNLMGIAEDLAVAIKRYGCIDDVANRIGLSASMLRRFQAVERLDPVLQGLVTERVIDSIDSVAELGSLSPALQRALAKHLRTEKFDTMDIRSCVRLLNRDPGMATEDVLRKVGESKSIRLYVYEFVIKDSMGTKTDLEKRVQKVLGDDAIASVEIGVATGRLKLTRLGRRMVSALAKKHRTTTQNFIQMLCEGIST